MPSQRRSAAKPAAEAATDSATRVLKKYPNRRLYDTRTSSYITLADVKQMVLEGETFEVRDAKTGDELTRSILLQIILEEETGGVPMFTESALANMYCVFTTRPSTCRAALPSKARACTTPRPSRPRCGPSS